MTDAPRPTPPPLALPEGADLAALQRYVHDLEALHGWLDTDLVHNCFLMGEEVGEVFAAVRAVHEHDARSADEASGVGDRPALVDEVGDELVDVLNYLLALANRLDIDLEAAFRRKNRRNETRTWD